MDSAPAPCLRPDRRAKFLKKLGVARFFSFLWSDRNGRMARLEDGLIEEAITPVVAITGLQLVDVEWRELRPRGLLRLYVDKPGAWGSATASA